MLNVAEWDQFRVGFSCQRDDVEESEDEDTPGTTGIAVFDGLPKSQRLALLATVAKGSTDDDVPLRGRDG